MFFEICVSYLLVTTAIDRVERFYITWHVRMLHVFHVVLLHNVTRRRGLQYITSRSVTLCLWQVLLHGARRQTEKFVDDFSNRLVKFSNSAQPVAMLTVDDDDDACQ